jgi:hypothetical protein
MIGTIGLKRKLRRPHKLIDVKFVHREAELRERYCRRLTEETELRRLAQATQIRDLELLERLTAAGFRVETLPALTMVPIAFAAWGSGVVTESEKEFAGAAAAAALFGRSNAICMFRSWLKHRPDTGLWELWEDYTANALQFVESADREEAGRTLLYLARRVALASGGFLGFGRICVAEQQVLDGIRRVYGLE